MKPKIVFNRNIISVIICVIVFITALIFLSLGGAILISKNIVAENAMSWIGVIIWILSGLCASIVGKCIFKENILLNILISTSISVIVLALLALILFSEGYKNIGQGIGCIFIGSVPTVFFALQPKNKKGKYTHR